MNYSINLMLNNTLNCYIHKTLIMVETDEYDRIGNSSMEIAKHSLNKCNVNNDQNIIKFVNITSYNTERIINTESLNNYMKILQEQAAEDNKNVAIHDNFKFSLLEILTDQRVRMYFDIENIPRDNQEMIYEIINKIYEIMNLKDDQQHRNYALTFNNNSHHEGLSYHLFLPIRSTKTDIYNFIKLFNFRTDYKYVNMIDYRVYGQDRLFRTVGSRCPSLNSSTPRNQENYHKLIKGELVDTIIQNYNNLDTIFRCKISPTLDYYFNERINKVNSQLSDEIKTVLFY